MKTFISISHITIAIILSIVAIMFTVPSAKSQSFKETKTKDATSFIYQFSITNDFMQDIVFSLENIKCATCQPEQIKFVSQNSSNSIHLSEYDIYPSTITEKKVRVHALPAGNYSVSIDQVKKTSCEFVVNVYSERTDKIYFDIQIFGMGTTADLTSYLYWSVPSESDIEQYEIEKLNNGRWEFIAAHEANGNSSSPLSYSMPVYNDFGSNMYRLKQVDKKDNALYSQKLEVKWNGNGVDFDAFMNPTNSAELFISVITLQKKNFTLSIKNNKGEEIFNKKMMKEKGHFNSTIDLGQKFEMGTYLVEGSIDEQTFNKRIYILN